MSNHAAIIAKVEKVIPIQGADKIHVAEILGEFCIVSKEIDVGYVGVLFPADLQLSVEFAKENNLFRDSTLNKDITVKGYFDSNRKVRAQVFMGVRSTAFFTSVDSLSFTNHSELSVGDRINVLNGVAICERYVSPQTKEVREKNSKQNPPRKKAIPLFKEHKDTAQFNHFVNMIPVGAILSFHAKKHGTSFRVGKLPSHQPLKWWQKIVNKVIPDAYTGETWENVVGTRRVVLKNEDSVGFHGKDTYRHEIAKQIYPKLVKGMQVYGEIVGFVNGTSIMPKHSVKELKDKEMLKKYGEHITYSYNNSPDEYDFHIYRITQTDVEGNIHEWDQQKMEKWCAENGFKTTLDVNPQIVYDGDVEGLKELVYELTERPSLLCEDYEDPTHISEGIIIRVDYKGNTSFYKNKSIPFKIMEGILTVSDEEDVN